jgi:hypothetical protein
MMIERMAQSFGLGGDAGGLPCCPARGFSDGSTRRSRIDL